jgi:uncharacterized membrane protein YfcA
VVDDILQILILLISGIGSGIFVGMGSGTTGSIMITSLTVFLGYSIHQSIGTSLLIDCIIGGIAGIIFLKKGNTNFKPAFTIAAFGAIGSFIGGQFTSSAPELGLIILISSILILLGLSFIIKGLQKNIDYIKEKGKVKYLKKHKIKFFIGFGLIAGASSGFTGMGIGGVVALILMLFLDYDIHTAIGTALLSIMFISGAGAMGHVLNGEVLLGAGLIAGSAAVIGAVVGSFAANKINEEKLGRIVGVLILFMGLILLFRAF